MRGKTRFTAVALLAALGLSALTGCIIVPDDGYYGHHHHWDYDGDRDRDHRDWR